jgi:hypothetical protein
MENKDERQFFPFGVRVVTSSRIIYQGTLQVPPIPPPPPFPPFPPPPPVDGRFIFVLLNCPPEFITDDGARTTIYPFLFDEGDVVKINVDEIVVGPSGNCLVDATTATQAPG